MSQHNNIIHPECEKEEVVETVFIECYNCIHKLREAKCCNSSGSIIYEIDCNCRDKQITKLICKKCEIVKDRITYLKDVT